MTKLVCTEDGASKFWEGVVEGTSLTVRFGKIGTAGQTKTKSFASAAEAEKELAKLVKEKRGKGYVDNAPGEGGAAGLGDALAALDPLWKAKRSQVFASLRPGVDAAQTEGLKKVLGKKPLPPDLVAWFAWHDGQKSGLSLSTDDNYFMHSLESAIETWEFLNDPTEDVQKPIDPAWIPLFENGAGDHRVYDLATGAILGFFHDDAARPKEHESLLAWAAATKRALEKEKAAKGRDVSLAEVGWTELTKVPTEDEIGASPKGRLFHYVYLSTMGAQPKPTNQLFVKVDADTWLHATHPDLATALQRLEEHLRTPPAKDSGYWKKDWDVWRGVTKKAEGAVREATASGL